MAALTMVQDNTESAQVGLMRAELQVGLSLVKIAASDTYTDEHRQRARGEAQKAYEGVLRELNSVAFLSPEDELWIGQILEELRRKLKALAANSQNNKEAIAAEAPCQ